MMYNHLESLIKILITFSPSAIFHFYLVNSYMCPRSVNIFKAPQLILIQIQICDFLVYNNNSSFSNNFLTSVVSLTILLY